MINYKTFKFFLLIIVLPLQACFFHIESSHRGKVIDAETKKPLNDVVVILTIVGYSPGIGTGGDHKDVAIKETRTDEKGDYRFSWEFYAMPFYHFYNDTIVTYIKPSYFEKRKSHSEGNDVTELFKMTHYLDFHFYRDHYFSTHSLEDESEYFREAIRQNRTIKLTPNGENGVFEVYQGMAFSKIYSTINSPDSISYAPENISTMLYYYYDETARKWLTIDSRGKIVEHNVIDLPEWYFFSSNLVWGSPIFANTKHIFYPVEKNLIPAGLEYRKGEIKYIEPSIGDISALAGVVDFFFTIEDQGSSLCNYKNREISKCYKGTDLPESENDDTISNSKFKYIIQVVNSGYFIVTKTPKRWHLYNYDNVYNAKTKKAEMVFKELLISFPVEREITAITTHGENLFLAFKNDGIRKYGLDGKENTEFFSNSIKAQYPDIYSLVVGRTITDYAIYAVSGGNAIYRFSTDGIPDYKVNSNEPE